MRARPEVFTARASAWSGRARPVGCPGGLRAGRRLPASPPQSRRPREAPRHGGRRPHREASHREIALDRRRDFYRLRRATALELLSCAVDDRNLIAQVQFRRRRCRTRNIRRRRGSHGHGLWHGSIHDDSSVMGGGRVDVSRRLQRRARCYGGSRPHRDAHHDDGAEAHQRGGHLTEDGPSADVRGGRRASGAPLLSATALANAAGEGCSARHASRIPRRRGSSRSRMRRGSLICVLYAPGSAASLPRTPRARGAAAMHVPRGSARASEIAAIVISSNS